MRGQTNGDAFEAFTIPKHARCCVGFCDNHKRFPNILVVRSHLKELKFHTWPKDPNLAELWRKQIAKGRNDNFNPGSGSEGTFVCSNHFPEGTRTRHNPSTDYSSVFLTLSDFLNKPSPKKRKVSERLVGEENKGDVTTAEGTVERADNEEDDLDHDDQNLRVPMRFEQISREADVKTFTGLPSTKCFKCIFDQLFPKAQHMQYWRGLKQTAREAPQDYGEAGIVSIAKMSAVYLLHGLDSSDVQSAVSLNDLAKQTTSKKKDFASLFQETIPKGEMHN